MPPADPSPHCCPPVFPFLLPSMPSPRGHSASHSAAMLHCQRPFRVPHFALGAGGTCRRVPEKMLGWWVTLPLLVGSNHCAMLVSFSAQRNRQWGCLALPTSGSCSHCCSALRCGKREPCKMMKRSSVSTHCHERVREWRASRAAPGVQPLAFASRRSSRGTPQRAQRGKLPAHCCPFPR